MSIFMRMVMDVVGIFNDQSLNRTDESRSSVEGSGNVTEYIWDDDGDAKHADQKGLDSRDILQVDVDKSESRSKSAKKDAAITSDANTLTPDSIFNEMDVRRKLKNAKKKAVKRLKMKEKKQRDGEGGALDGISDDSDSTEKINVAPDKRNQIRDVGIRLAKEISAAAVGGNLARIQEIVSFSSIDSASCLNAVTAIFDQSNGNQNSHPNRHAISLLYQSLSRYFILHSCISMFPSPAIHRQSKASPVESDVIPPDSELSAQRISIAKYLLSLPYNIVDLKSVDGDGRNVLQVAIKSLDIDFINFLFSLRGETEESISTFLYLANYQCAKGWSALHYAVDMAIVPVVRKLINFGANLLLKATKAHKHQTALDIAKNRLQNSSHFVSEFINSSQIIAKELSEAIRNSSKTSHNNSISESFASDSDDDESVDMVDSDENDWAREKVLTSEKRSHDSTHLAVSQSNSSSNALLTESSHNQLNRKKAASMGNANSNNRESGAMQISKAAQNSKQINSKKVIEISELDDHIGNFKTEVVNEPSIKKIGNSGLSSDDSAAFNSRVFEPKSIDVASRDELLDYLLTMGFSEKDCLSAIAFSGRNLDAAIAWLCDIPSRSSESSSEPISLSTATMSASIKPAQSSGIKVAGPSVRSGASPATKILTPARVDDRIKKVESVSNRSADNKVLTTLRSTPGISVKSRSSKVPHGGSNSKLYNKASPSAHILDEDAFPSLAESIKGTPPKLSNSGSPQVSASSTESSSIRSQSTYKSHSNLPSYAYAIDGSDSTIESLNQQASVHPDIAQPSQMDHTSMLYMANSTMAPTRLAYHSTGSSTLSYDLSGVSAGTNMSLGYESSSSTLSPPTPPLLPSNHVLNPDGSIQELSARAQPFVPKAATLMPSMYPSSNMKPQGVPGHFPSTKNTDSAIAFSSLTVPSSSTTSMASAYSNKMNVSLSSATSSAKSGWLGGSRLASSQLSNILGVAGETLDPTLSAWGPAIHNKAPLQLTPKVFSSPSTHGLESIHDTSAGSGALINLGAMAAAGVSVSDFPRRFSGVGLEPISYAGLSGASVASGVGSPIEANPYPYEYNSSDSGLPAEIPNGGFSNWVDIFGSQSDGKEGVAVDKLG